MDLHWQPVGPLPAAVYWRRRLVLAAATLLVLVLAGLPLLGGDDVLAGPSATPPPQVEATAEATADATADGTADPSASPNGPEACPDDAIEVTASSGSASVPVGGTAQLEVAVRNTGSVPCLRAVGEGAVELVVTSGDDRIWSSDDCEPGGDPGEVLLEPGAVETASVSWSTVRSAPDCPDDPQQAAAGTYRVTARVGELQSAGAVFTLTG